MSKTTSGRTVKKPNRWTYAKETPKKRTGGKSLAKIGFYSKNPQTQCPDLMDLPAIMRYEDSSEKVIERVVEEHRKELDKNYPSQIGPR